MKLRAAIFDLDGTLVNTLDDIARSMNTVLARHGYPGHPADAYRHFVGDGMETLVRRTVPEPLSRNSALVAVCLADMRVEYSRHCYDSSFPYPGIRNMLEKAASLGLPLAVLSNKPEDFTVAMVERYFEGIPFFAVRGLRDGTPRKPDPAGAILIARESGIAPKEFLYLGDTATDMMTARAAGMYAVGAAWGFRGEKELIDNGAQAIVQSPGEVVTLFC